jgi:hypothetical protein
VEDSWIAASGRLAPVEGSSFRSLKEIGLFAVRSGQPRESGYADYDWFRVE